MNTTSYKLRQRGYHDTWKQRHPERVKDSQARRRLIMRQELDALKNRPCSDCYGWYEPCQMDFDHLDPSTKIMGVGTMVYCGRKLIRDEIAKCELVCANCHRLRTEKRRREGRY